MQGKRTDLINHRFGQLVVVASAGNIYKTPKSAIALWLCRCDCGTEITAEASKLKRGRLLSCGCLRKKHGHNRRGKRTKTYNAWAGMRSRCHNPKSPDYKDYGKRGIKVCDRWNSYENFLADMGERPPGKSIERRDNDGDYDPSNCFWATPVEQANNKRNTGYIDFRGQKWSIGNLAREHGISEPVLFGRIFRYGWSVEDAVSKPVSHRTANLTFVYHGKEFKLSELVQVAKVSRRTLYARLHSPSKWTVEDAVETPVVQCKERSPR